MLKFYDFVHNLYESNELSSILNLSYEEFVERLGELAHDHKLQQYIGAGKIDGLPKDEEIKFTQRTIPVKNLRPTQNEIDVEKSLKLPLSNSFPNATSDIIQGDKVILLVPIVTLNGQYIIDGHHRWSQVYAMNSEATMICFNMEMKTDPITALKAVQMSIALDKKKVPISRVEGHNLLNISDRTLHDYVIDNVVPPVINLMFNHQLIDEATPEAVSKLVIDNVNVMKKRSQPIKGAPARDYMPQTGHSDHWASQLKQGVVNFKEPIDPK